jgi:protein O-mannosyl-transferase
MYNPAKMKLAKSKLWTYFYLLLSANILILFFLLPGSDYFQLLAGLILLSVPVLSQLAIAAMSKTKFLSTGFWLMFTVLLATVIAYFPAISNGFTNWDDPAYVLDNPLVKNFSFIEIFKAPFKGMYQPISILSLSIDYQLAEMNEHFFHFINILIHLFNTLLVFFIVQKLFKERRIAFLTALFFGIATIHVESVVWITERKDMLFSFFFLMSFYYYLNYKETGQGRVYLISIICFLFSLLSKPQGVMLAPTLILVDYLHGRKILSRENLLNKIPYFLLAAIAGIVALLLSEGEAPEISVYKKALLAGYSLMVYLFKCIIPFNLSAIYPYPENPDTLHYIGFVASVLLVISSVYLMKKENNMGFALLFFLLNIILLLQIIPNTYTLMADRYSYIPSIGIYLLIAILLNPLLKKQKEKKLIWGGIALYSIITLFTTIQRGKVWENSLTLWNDVLEQYDYVPEALNNRGMVYFLSGNYSKALADFNRAIEIENNSFEGYLNRSAVLIETGDFEQALRDLDKAEKLNYKESEIFQNRGLVFEKLGEFEKAIINFNMAIGLDKFNAETYISRGAIYLNDGNFDQALKDLNDATRLDPNNYLAWANKGLANARAGNVQLAINDFSQAILLNPGFPDAYSNRGLSKFQQGNISGSIKDLSKAIELNPQMGIAYMNRGRAWLQAGNNERACKDFNKAVQLGISAAENALANYCN